MKRPQPSRILLLIPHLGGGGAERVMELLARFLNSDRFEIHLCLVSESCPNAITLPPSVTIHELGATRVRYSVISLLRLVWKIRPDVVLSGIAHLNLLVLLLRPFLPGTTRILVRQNGELAATLGVGFYKSLSHRAYAAAYRQADRVICQTESMASEIGNQLRVAPRKLMVLPNPVSPRQLPASDSAGGSPWSGSGPNILAAGRLVPEKGFDLLLEAFATVPSRYCGAELVIAGSGHCESRLRQQATSLGIETRVHFIGYQQNPASLFRHASMFVLSSRTEGLPNALLEAAAAGLPIVATPACPGLMDLLRDKEGVWLAGDTSSNALRSALGSALSSIKSGRRYPHSWMEPFDSNHAIPAYEHAIDTVLQERT